MFKRMTLVSSVLMGFCLLVGVRAQSDTMRFLIWGSANPVPHLDQWQSLAQEFAEADPDIDSVQLITESRDLDTQMAAVDCPYSFFNHTLTADPALLQPLDEFLDADPALDRADVPDLLWTQVTKANDGYVYAIPLTLNPVMMWYEPTAFAGANTPVPQNGWSGEDFVSAVKALHTDRGEAVYETRNFNLAAYMMLAAVLGGQPADYSTYLPTYRLTDPNVVKALRTILDLAKADALAYDGWGRLSLLGSGSLTHTDNPVVLYDGWGLHSNRQYTPFTPVLFPQSADVIPLSFDFGVASITAGSAHASACYRWISTLSQHAELFDDMPAHRSQLNNTALIESQGQSVVDQYALLFDQMNNPQAVLFPVGFTAHISPEDATMQVFLGQALDAYVQDGADLDTSLAEAQMKIDAYRDCIASQPAYDALVTRQEAKTYAEARRACIIQVEPEAERYLQPTSP